MRLATVREVREIDERSQKPEFGLSSETLMENAGTLAAEEIARRFAHLFHSEAYAVVVCGPGKNGGDGLICARVLRDKGIATRIVKLKNFEESQSSEILKAALVIDAVFGIGLNRQISGAVQTLIRTMNSASCPKVSLDVPSGLNADTGVASGSAVRADLTLSFGIGKIGFAVNEGPGLVGELLVLDIGYPKALLNEIANSNFGFDHKLATRFLPRRHFSGNKSTFGRVQIFAGRPGMGGAAMLCGLSAARIGAGYVSVATDGDPRKILAESPEFMTSQLSDKKLFRNPTWNSVVVGPGLGPRSFEILKKLKASSHSAAVIDADGLTSLSKNLSLELPSNWILTPHAGEMSRLLGVDSKLIEADRFRYAKEASLRFKCIVLLKGFRTVVSDGHRSVVILSGNSALAKAGMGDVLSGLIAGLLAQGLSPFTAACLGAFVHGYLAEQWLRSGKDILSFQPSDLSAALPYVLKELRSS